MHINRDNYESFFLLYIDNELSAQDKVAVDQFVQLNPDLEEELVMLGQTVLKADDVTFDLKDSLFRSASSGSEIETKLLLHLDHELDTAEKKQLLTLIQDNPAIKNQWEILQATRLDKNEQIPFPDKTLLYRHEGGRVVAFPWLRVAAAAMFIGVATWAGVSYLNTDRPAMDVEPIVKTEVRAPAAPKKERSVTDQPRLAETVVTEEEKTTSLAQTKANAVRAGKVVTPTIKRTKSALPEKQSETIAVKTEQRSNNLPALSSENINRSSSNNTITASVTPKTPDNNIRPGKNENVADEYTKADATNSFATSASFNEAENRNEDHVFFLPEDKVKKTKLGGFFRKVKRVIERTANVKEGNHIKVANLEFAIQ